MISNYKDSVEVYFRKYIKNDIDNIRIYEEKQLLTSEASFNVEKGRSYRNGQLTRYENKELLIFENTDKLSKKDKIIVKEIEYKIIDIDDTNKYYILIELMENKE